MLPEHTLKAVDSSISYASYRSMIDELLAQDKTTGLIQTEEFIHYTKMNEVRMSRLDKTTKLLTESEELAAEIVNPITILVITEAWCGDAAQVIPVVEQMLGTHEQVSTKYVLRDEHLDLIDAHLTSGGRSIPKFIFIDESVGKVLGEWGPRPKEVQDLVEARKSMVEPTPYSEFSVVVQKWYAQDKTKGIQLEFGQALRTAMSKMKKHA